MENAGVFRMKSGFFGMLIFTAMRRRTTQSMLAEGLVHPANRTPKPKTEKKPIPSRTGAKPETQSSAPLEAPARAPGSSFPVSQFPYFPVASSPAGCPSCRPDFCYFYDNLVALG